MSTPEIKKNERTLHRAVHTTPHWGNQWIVRVDGEIGYLKSFKNKCEAIDYGREISIVNQAEHWIHHSNGSIMSRETCSDIVKLLNLENHGLTVVQE